MHLSQVRDESTLSANRNAVAPFSPGLAASATLGTSFVESQPQGGCDRFSFLEEMTQPLCG